MSKNLKTIQNARTLLQSQCNGVLSTLSVDVPGYPFGSITPFCLDSLGRPIILISTIAQHTRNIKADNRVSLIAYDAEATDNQASGRVTYIGNAVMNNDDAVRERYYRFHPNSQAFNKTHDFDFYVLDCVRVRFIGGFGDINWIEKEHFLAANPFNNEQELGMVEHMNEDHQDAVAHYCDLYNIDYAQNDSPKLVGIDGEGFHISANERLHRISFESTVNSANEVRQALVALAKKQLPDG